MLSGSVVKRLNRIGTLVLLAMFVAAVVLIPFAWMTAPPALAVIGPCMPAFSQHAGSPVGVGTTPSSVAVGRFNSDTFDDLAVTNDHSDDVTILLGNGSGGFTAASGSPISVG